VAYRRRPAVVDETGQRGTLRRVRVDTPHGPAAVIELRSGEVVEVSFDLLEHHSDGGYFMRGRLRDRISRHEEGAAIPVIAERVTTSIRPAPERRVRIRRRVVAEPHVVDTPVWRERVEVEHVVVDKDVDRVPETRREGDTWIIPRVEEVTIVEKRLRLREELRVRVIRERHVDQQTVVLRRHEIDVEPESEIPNPKKHEGEHS
jgi:hypothetical protein